jgi:hypothetical protein
MFYELSMTPKLEKLEELVFTSFSCFCEDMFTNGWYMIVKPDTGRILSVTQQFEPENNDTVTVALEKVIHLYAKANCFGYDRNCKYAPVNSQRPLLNQIKYWPVDKWHGIKGHNKKCKYHPVHVARLKKRVKHMNTSKAEQIFSWFRGYASTFNSMDALRHRLIVLNYCKEHNALIDTGYSCHLNAHSANRTNPKRSRTTSGYACSKKAKK